MRRDAWTVLVLLAAGCGGSAESPEGPTMTRCVGAIAEPSKGFRSEQMCRTPAPVIRGVVQARADRQRACYARALATDPTAAGRVAMRFQFREDGDVVGVCGSVAGPLASEEFLDCMNDAFATMRFPPGDCEGRVTVTYPIIMTPG